ncbi:MAG: AraC family transcriptional regulator [Campylobacteraceae bacterium]|jgi:YesN/AraC family two-component response regulator|nr:AraC family transcriptional regulator [Campylobacteraceae bacterium]
MIYQATIKANCELLKIENSSCSFPIHFHKRFCIGKVIFGEKYITINNREKKISKNEIFIIPPYIAHSCRANGSIDYLVFCFDYNKSSDTETLSEGANFLNINLDEITKLVNNTCNNIFIKNNIVDYLIRYLEDNYNSDIKLNWLANKLGYSKYYILHLFKEKVGISLHQYIIQLRIKKAKRKNKSNNLLGIALESGFFDRSHFIKNFKKYEGITPKEYYKSTK